MAVNVKMMNKIKIQSKARGYNEFEIILEKPMSRIIFKTGISGKGVKGRLINANLELINPR